MDCVREVGILSIIGPQAIEYKDKKDKGSEVEQIIK